MLEREDAEIFVVQDAMDGAGQRDDLRSLCEVDEDEDFLPLLLVGRHRRLPALSRRKL